MLFPFIIAFLHLTKEKLAAHSSYIIGDMKLCGPEQIWKMHSLLDSWGSNQGLGVGVGGWGVGWGEGLPLGITEGSRGHSQQMYTVHSLSKKGVSLMVKRFIFGHEVGSGSLFI